MNTNEPAQVSSIPAHKPWQPPRKEFLDFELLDRLASYEDTNVGLALAADLHKRGQFDDEEFELAAEYIADAPQRRALAKREAQRAEQAAKDQRQSLQTELVQLRQELEKPNLSDTTRATKLLRAHELKKVLTSTKA